MDILLLCDPAQESRIPRPTHLSHQRGKNRVFAVEVVNYSPYFVAGLLNCINTDSAANNFLYNLLYTDFNSIVTWLIVNAKNGLDFALGHLSNFVYIYITVEE